MGVIELHVQRIRRQGGSVVLVQLEQRMRQARAAGLRDRVGVRLELMLARQLGQKRRNEKRKHGHRKQEQQQRECIVRRIQLRPQVWDHAKPGIEPCLARQPAQQCEARQAQGKQASDAFEDVFVLEMPELVRQYGLDLTGFIDSNTKTRINLI